MRNKIILMTCAIAATSCGSLANSGSKAVGASSGIGGFRIQSISLTDGATSCDGSGVTVSFHDTREDRSQLADYEEEHSYSDYEMYACIKGSKPKVEETAEKASGENDAADTADADTIRRNKFIELCTAQYAAGQTTTYLALQSILNVSTTIQNPSLDQNQTAETEQQPTAPNTTLFGLAEDEPNIVIEATIEGQDGKTTTQSGSICQNIFDAGNKTTNFNFSQSSPQITDLRPLKYFSSMDTLNISNNPVDTAAGLTSLPSITTLLFDNTPLAKAYIDWKTD